MSASHSPFPLIFRITVCLALFALFPFSPVDVDSSQTQPVPSGLSAGDWRSILRVIQKDLAAPSNTWTQLAHLSPSDAKDMMAFGYSVAVDGDTVVVGADWDHQDGPSGPIYGVGAAYVFEKPALGWWTVSEAAKLTTSDYTAHFREKFGFSVAVSGNTVVVSCPWDDPAGVFDAGAVYVFEKTGFGWTDMTETAKLTASDGASSDEFGRRVAISGETIAVGAPYDNVDGHADQGSVYVFQRPVGGWTTGTETAHSTASDGVAGDMLGASVAISGSTLVAGAYAHNNGQGLASGQAYVFHQSGGWISGTETARLKPSAGADHIYFGWSVGVDGDTVVVGAPGEINLDKVGEESAYVFVRPALGWSNMTETAILTASDRSYWDDFGTSVAVSGDLVVVGAIYDDIGGQVDQGSAYVFLKPGGGWTSMTQTVKLAAGDGANGDQFGASVAISGETILVGSPKDSITAGNDDTGSAYVFVNLPDATEKIYLPLTLR